MVSLAFGPLFMAVVLMLMLVPMPMVVPVATSPASLDRRL